MKALGRKVVPPAKGIAPERWLPVPEKPHLERSSTTGMLRTREFHIPLNPKGSP